VIVTTTGPKRQTADERREAVLLAAIEEFAMYGYYGGSTERIAAEVGISQPYVQRLFGTKKALFIAAVEQVCDGIVGAWKETLKGIPEGMPPELQIEALRPAYYQFVEAVSGLRLVLQASAAAADSDIRMHVKRRMAEMFSWLRATTGADYETVRIFWAQGMTLTIAASIGAMQDARESEWARAMLMLPNDMATREAHCSPAATGDAEPAGR
jgi:AcrR family transcriptional regulator